MSLGRQASSLLQLLEAVTRACLHLWPRLWSATGACEGRPEREVQALLKFKIIGAPGLALRAGMMGGPRRRHRATAGDTGTRGSLDNLTDCVQAVAASYDRALATGETWPRPAPPPRIPPAAAGFAVDAAGR